jgi:deoxyribonuclease-4
VEFTPDGNEKWLTPLKKGELRFERLAEALADLKPEMTLISSSPLLEHDAVYMRTLTERVLSKKAAKFLKDKKKQELEASEAPAAAE